MRTVADRRLTNQYLLLDESPQNARPSGITSGVTDLAAVKPSASAHFLQGQACDWADHTDDVVL